MGTDIAITKKIVENKGVNPSPKLIGFIQAAGLALYVSLFATLVQQAQSWLLLHNIQPNPILSIVLFLLVFVISALICGSLIFAYPLLLFSSGRRSEAAKTVLWSLIWLVVIALFVTLLSFFFLQPRL